MTSPALQRLREIVGAAGISTDPEANAAWLRDERRLFTGAVLAVVSPVSTAELAAVMAYCYASGIPMVPQGGNTGYCGGATPDASGRAVLLRLARMNRVRGIDPVSFTMTAEAGVVLADAQRAAAAHGLLFPLSMGSEKSCQLGGNLATNAGGLAVLRYGTARDLVLGLEVVLPDGRIWDGLSALRKDNTGYDLKQLFLGAEGTLGVITAAVCKLFPAPITRETALCAVTELAAACRLLGMVRRSLGDCVVSFEFLARPALELVLANISDTRDPFVAAHPAYVLLELTGGHAARGLREELMAVYADAEAQGLVGDALIAESESQRSAWWRLREQIPAAERAAGGSIKHDVSVALADLPTLAQRAGAAVVSRHPGVRVSMYGHVGDGNLHFNVLAPVGADPETFRAAHAASVSDLVHRTAVELGGSFSAEHGVGQLKRDLLRVTESPIALDLMREIKAAVDPKDLMNPGKVL